MNPWTVACQASLCVGFPRQDTAVGCHFLLQKFGLVKQNIKIMLPVENNNLSLLRTAVMSVPKLLIKWSVIFLYPKMFPKPEQITCSRLDSSK